METIEGFTHFDSKFIRSVKLLITRPGLLTCYFSEGRRVAFMKPLPLFIVCNILFFLLTASVNSFSIMLSNFYQFKPYTLFGTIEMVNAKLAAGWSEQMLAMIFNERMAAQSKSYILFFIPILAGYNALVFLRKKRYFTEHLVFSLHFFCFILIFYVLSKWLVDAPFRWISGMNYSSTFDMISTFAGMIVFGVYYTFAASRYYRVSKWHSITAAVLVVVLYQTMIMVYRMLLFYKIMYFMN
jgi:hypothetical protein